MSYLNTQALFGTIVFGRHILAGASAVRRLGVGMSEAFYAAALVVIGLVSTTYQFIGKRHGRG